MRGASMTSLPWASNCSSGWTARGKGERKPWTRNDDQPPCPDRGRSEGLWVVVCRTVRAAIRSLGSLRRVPPA
jgi:hypothetical protein